MRAIIEWLPILWAFCSLLALAGPLLYLRALRPLPPAEATPPAMLIVPVRGGGDGLAGFLRALEAQDWPDWQVIFAVDSPQDTSVAQLTPFIARDPGRRRLVVAPPATRRSQKVENQLAALALPRDPRAIVVLADADGAPGPGWLRNLLRPIALGRAELTTGYRWILPLDAPWHSPWSWTMALADLPLSTLARSRSRNIAWGGSIAITPSALVTLDLPRIWAGALTDDMSLTLAARRQGVTLHHTHWVLVPNPVRADRATTINFALRHYRTLRVLMPNWFAWAGAMLLVPLAGAGASLAGASTGPWAAAIAFISLQLRLTSALRIAALALPPEAQALARREIAWARVLMPVAHLARAGFWLASCGGRGIRWAGIGYRMGGKESTDVFR